MSLNLNGIGHWSVYRYSPACGDSRLFESKAVERYNCAYSRWILYRKAGNFDTLSFDYINSNVSIQIFNIEMKRLLYLNQADWRAVRGALVGCLALMKRKDVAGVVTDIDAQAMAKSMIQNVQVQALPLHERKV